MMKKPLKLALVAASFAVASAVILVVLGTTERERPVQKAAQPAVEQSSLTVALTTLQRASLPSRVYANGNILAWQEASIGSEADGLRLTAVKVNVGDLVRRGQPLATFATDTVEADLAKSRAALAEAEVVHVEATANAERARLLQESGVLSGQQIQQSIHAESTARARRDSARANERTQRLRLAQTRIAAPEDGIISARAATVGAVLPAGEELFRLILGGRLEWRAEVAATDLARLKPGQRVRVRPTGGEAIEGRVRMLSPVIDLSTRNGLAYVDLPASDTARTGMFARGEFEIGSDEGMTLPQSAVHLREGFSYVMRVGPDSRVIQTKVKTGRRVGDRVEIVGGLDGRDRVVASGAAFLGDGQLVRVAVGHGASSPSAPTTVPSPAPRRLTLASDAPAR